MFEKEAEEYQIRKHHQRLYGNKPVVMKELNTTYKDGFKDGYNKANEWHYVKDEEECKYPENRKSVLVTVLDDNNEKIVTMALFELENNKRFWGIESRLCSVHSGSEEVCSKIIAWARVLPAGGEK